jgi:hypothetical protein
MVEMEFVDNLDLYITFKNEKEIEKAASDNGLRCRLVINNSDSKSKIEKAAKICFTSSYKKSFAHMHYDGKTYTITMNQDFYRKVKDKGFERVSGGPNIEVKLNK